MITGGTLILFHILVIAPGLASQACQKKPRIEGVDLSSPIPHRFKFEYRNRNDWLLMRAGNRDQLCEICCNQNPVIRDEWFAVDTYLNQVQIGRLFCGCNKCDMYKKVNLCRKPKGDDCNWYSTCLNRYSAKPATLNTTDGNYALSYGLKYCKKFEENLLEFSEEGRAWISKARKCFQDALARYVNTDKTNDEIKEIAFDSHTRCYVEYGLCDLPPSDWGVIVNTVGDALLSEFLKTGGNVVTSSAHYTQKVAARIRNWELDKAKATVHSVKKVVDAKLVRDDVDDRIDAITTAAQKDFNLKKILDALPKLG